MNEAGGSTPASSLAALFPRKKKRPATRNGRGGAADWDFLLPSDDPLDGG
jgi:hypothetical protein